jgi:hypothetical protein
MARRKSRRKFPDVIQPAPGRERRRSLEAPLLWIGVALFAGFPMVRDATSEPMLRNRYGSDLRSCECDYGQDRCVRQDGGWVGPWYARDAADVRPDDPGRGVCRVRSGGYSYAYSGRSSGQDDGYRAPASVESGYRGGFGGSGRVRAAGS